MNSRLALVSTICAALGSGLIGGVFFAFSTFVTKALVRLPLGQGIAAMQSINVTVINPWFMTAFLGTAAVCIVLFVKALGDWRNPASPYVLGGSVLYLLGSTLVTLLWNVPRNNALAAIDIAAPGGPAAWAEFVPAWMAGNHVRTIASLLAAASFTIGLTKMP